MDAGQGLNPRRGIGKGFVGMRWHIPEQCPRRADLVGRRKIEDRTIRQLHDITRNLGKVLYTAGFAWAVSNDADAVAVQRPQQG